MSGFWIQLHFRAKMDLVLANFVNLDMLNSNNYGAIFSLASSAAILDFKMATILDIYFPIIRLSDHLKHLF